MEPINLRIQPGVPTVEEYHAVLKSDLFSEMQDFSERFLQSNSPILSGYAKKWVTDPLHQWSRQWEYPFVFTGISEFFLGGRGSNARILDAGSGATFFPYFIASKISGAGIFCCDSDPSLKRLFENIRNPERLIRFSVENISCLSYENNSFDMVYCVSVLEHVKDRTGAVSEIKRVLKKGGVFILTFDLSLNGDAEISLEDAEQLLKLLEENFERMGPLFSESLAERLKGQDLLTTRYLWGFDRKLLPWRHPVLSVLKRLFRYRLPKGVVPNLTCYGCAFRKR